MKRKAENPDVRYDVIVVGGGLAGLSLTALLAKDGVRVLCLDRDPPQEQLKETFDGRTTAVSWGSRKILDAAGIWGAVADEGCAIETIHIMDGGGPVLLEFPCAETGGRPFGWIVENRLLRRTMLDRVRSLDTATHIAPAAVSDFSVDDDEACVLLDDGRRFAAQLVIGADGRFSFTREWMGVGERQWRYRQRALSFTVVHEHAHGNIAVEDFRSSGPFAILPMTEGRGGEHRSSVVWTEHGPDRRSALHYDEESFNAALSARFPERYGMVRLAGRRFSYPLGLVHAHDYIAPRMALVADAAHGIHPIAGQGLNLGFRDIALLAELIVAGDDPGAPEMLELYQRGRRADNMAMAGATDILNRLFSNDIPPLRAARRIGLRAVARMPSVRLFFMNQAMGAGGVLSPLIREAA